MRLGYTAQCGCSPRNHHGLQAGGKVVWEERSAKETKNKWPEWEEEMNARMPRDDVIQEGR